MSRGSKWFRIAVADVTRGSLDVRLSSDSSSAAEARHLVVDLCRRCGVPETMLPEIALAVSEATANAIAHAYAGSAAGDIDLWAAVTEDALTVVVRDYGRGPFGPAVTGADGGGASPTVTHSGLGVGVMSAVADSCDIEPARPGTCVRLRFRLDRLAV